MGELGGWGQASGLLPNGPSSPSIVASVTAETWAKAEERTAELIACIQPNQLSEERRNAVASYVQRLIMQCFSCQVFTFGSVPLKTYLPDGDIDLTVFSNDEVLKDTWANEVRDMLEKEERSEIAEFRVKEVQYIQAEVKIIKCLVENIVVDISFNQVGGLCTLCFLEEIDRLINQNHLFKRSIILIKAWCYYESRILGAHHGLISTYALETLVLYIFHVFNNSFAGPLEVLYRFLKFFSNFDWDNFCVSLWGPVPISSLPEMIAEPPRQDGGELLLSKHFLDTRSAAYAVMPGGQENQSQPFVSKHFNVVDPLRTNNNLGRSVSKGNFFRIRSAFAFGAKRLADLLECPKDLIAEVNQFFMNTWERHGSGNRPDAPSPSLQHSRPLKTVPVDGLNDVRATASTKNKSKTVILQNDNEHLADGGYDFHNSTSENLNNVSQQSNMHRTTNPPTSSRAQNQRSSSVQINSRVSELDRSNSSTGSVQSDKTQKGLRPSHSINYQEGQGRFQFARTRSSPELNEASVEVLSRGRRSRVLETGKTQNAPARVDYSSRTKNIGSELTSSHSTKSSLDDPLSLRHNSSHQSLGATSESNSVSNSYHDDVGFSHMGEELASVSETLDAQQEMLQEEQDLVNMMASSAGHNFNVQVQLPMHMASPHWPITLSPVLASMGYAQRNIAGIVPANLSLMGSAWGSNMQFPQGLVSSPLSHYFHPSRLNTNQDDMIESVNESSGMTDLNPDGEDSDHGIWHERDPGSSKGFNAESRGSQMLYVDGKQQSAQDVSSFNSSSRSSMTGALLRGQHKFAREDRGLLVEDYSDAFQNHTDRGNETNSNARSANVRSSTMSSASSSRSRPAFETMKDGSAAKFSRAARDKWARKPASSAVVTNLYGKTKSGWQYENTSDHVSGEVDDDNGDWVPLSTMGTDMPERITGSASLPSSTARNDQLHGYEPTQINGSESMVPFTQVLMGSSRQRAMDNSGMLPVTFVPTGPPVPFFTMVPVYNFASDAGNSDVSPGQFDGDEETECQTSPSDQNFDSRENRDQSDAQVSSAASRIAASEPPDEQESDILNSDLPSHWQNLLYGRLCQNNRGPLICPSPFMVPPVYLQGHFPWDGPGRPLPSNMNFTPMMGYGPPLAPVVPLQPGPDRASGAFQRYGDEAPRFRGDTGTYLPNLKPSFRDRQSNTRNHRGGFSNRSDHVDRDGSWSNSKPRAAGRSHLRSHAERSSPRPDRLAATENQAARQWESYRQEPTALYQAQNTSFGSRNSSHGSANMAYGMYPTPPASSNGVSSAGPNPPVVVLYSYD